MIFSLCFKMKLPADWSNSTFLQIAEWGEVNLDEKQLPNITNEEELKDRLKTLIDWLIDNQFEKLLYILYRVDVNETTVRQLIAENQTGDIASILADTIINRQKEKEIFKASYKVPVPEDMDEDLLL